MSSIANRSGGGMKLLETIAGGTTKATNYFSTIGEGYDALLIIGLSGYVWEENTIPAEEYTNASPITFGYENSTRGRITKNSSGLTFSAPSSGTITYKIYGIRL